MQLRRDIQGQHCENNQLISFGISNFQNIPKLVSQCYSHYELWLQKCCSWKRCRDVVSRQLPIDAESNAERPHQKTTDQTRFEIANQLESSQTYIMRNVVCRTDKVCAPCHSRSPAFRNGISGSDTMFIGFEKGRAHGTRVCAIGTWRFERSCRCVFVTRVMFWAFNCKPPKSRPKTEVALSW